MVRLLLALWGTTKLTYIASGLVDIPGSVYSECSLYPHFYLCRVSAYPSPSSDTLPFLTVSKCPKSCNQAIYLFLELHPACPWVWAAEHTPSHGPQQLPKLFLWACSLKHFLYSLDPNVQPRLSFRVIPQNPCVLQVHTSDEKDF